MEIKSVEFKKSSGLVEECPEDGLYDFAFIGRSNVGKSSLINYLSQRKQLAKISAVPGKTQLINHFIINEQFYLVDLPGYGFAKVPKKKKANFQQLIVDYIEVREKLLCLFVLIDIRHEAQSIDLEFLEYLGLKNIPFAIIFTKADKLSKAKRTVLVEKYKEKILETWEILPEIFITSSEARFGKEAILDYMESVLETSNS